jgi:hypothetical protein
MLPSPIAATVEGSLPLNRVAGSAHAGGLGILRAARCQRDGAAVMIVFLGVFITMMRARSPQ